MATFLEGVREMTHSEIEERLSAYPVCQYGFLKPDDIVFSEMVRYICETECPRYGKTWACPPAVGTVDECRERCRKYTDVLLFTSLAEVTDTALLNETLETRKAHEEITRGICKEFEEAGVEYLALSSESCDLCENCAYPDAPCRFPEHMMPCIESFGILVTESAEKCGIDFFYDNTTVTWFGMIFFNL